MKCNELFSLYLITSSNTVSRVCSWFQPRKTVYIKANWNYIKILARNINIQCRHHVYNCGSNESNSVYKIWRQNYTGFQTEFKNCTSVTVSNHTPNILAWCHIYNTLTQHNVTLVNTKLDSRHITQIIISTLLHVASINSPRLLSRYLINISLTQSHVPPVNIQVLSCPAII